MFYCFQLGISISTIYTYIYVIYYASLLSQIFFIVLIQSSSNHCFGLYSPHLLFVEKKYFSKECRIYDANILRKRVQKRIEIRWKKITSFSLNSFFYRLSKVTRFFLHVKNTNSKHGFVTSALEKCMQMVWTIFSLDANIYSINSQTPF